MPLSREECERFLAEPHTAAFGVDSSPGGRGPLMVPVWYQYEPGGEVWILTGADSRKAQMITQAGRFSLLVQRTEPTVRYVSVEGPVTGTTIGTHADHVELAVRYLPPAAVPGYVSLAETEFGEQLVIRMRPERWLSADMGAF